MSNKVEPPPALVAKFRAIAQERLARIDAGFGALEQGGAAPAPPGGGAPAAVDAAVDKLMREIHTLKGESRMMGLIQVSELAHRLEDLLAWARDRQFRVPDQAGDVVYLGLDVILQHVTGEGDERKRVRFLDSVASILRGDTAPEPVAPVEPQAATPAPAEAQQVGRGLGDFLRVPSAAIGKLTNLSGELILREETTARLVQALWERLRDTPLVDQLRRLRDEVFEVRLRLEEVQDTIRRMRLLELAALFERYPAAIRELARDHGKRVRVVVEGGDVAVDKQVLDLIDESLLHLVRNAVDHGVEPPETRKAAGKPEHGTISLTARQLGSRVEIAVKDDGAGLSIDRIRRTAVQRGVVAQAEADALEDDRLLQLVFRPGFSTREDVSDVSGRGVGLDVVREQVQALGGTIELATVAGQGSTFTLVLPVSIALIRVLCFRCGRSVFGVPSMSASAVLRAPLSALERDGERLAILLDGHPGSAEPSQEDAPAAHRLDGHPGSAEPSQEDAPAAHRLDGHPGSAEPSQEDAPAAHRSDEQRLPLVDLRRALGAARPPEDELQVLIVDHGAQRLGLIVDGFLGERQVVQRGLGRFLRGLRLVSGTGIIEKGQIALLLSVPELFARWGEGDLAARPAAEQAVSEAMRRILIVDDSEITRDMLVGFARRARLVVTEAVNGRDALAKIGAGAEVRPDLVLTDLEMPVMDGFELIAALRRDASLHELPIVVLSTRASDDDRRRALSAGADAYMIKQEFSEYALRQTIGRFVRKGR